MLYIKKKICLCARVLRESPVQAKSDSSSESSELTGESLDKMAATLQEYLSKKDADDVKKIVNNINSSKDGEQSIDDYVRIC